MIIIGDLVKATTIHIPFRINKYIYEEQMRVI